MGSASLMACKCPPFVLCRNPCSRRVPLRRFNSNPPKSPVTWTTAQVFRHRCTTRFPPHAAACRLGLARWSRPRYLVRMPHPARCPGHRSIMVHANRWALQSCNILRPNGGLLPPIYIRTPSCSACMLAWAHGEHVPPSGPVRAGFSSGILH